MSLFNELCRRNVFKFAAVYLATAWLLAQIAALTVETVDAPAWLTRVFVQVSLAGFPIALIAAWLLELTPEGLRLVKNVDPAQSISSKTGRQLTRGFIMILSMAIVLFLTDRFRDQVLSEVDEPQPGDQAVGQLLNPNKNGLSARLIHNTNPTGWDFS